MTVGLKIPGTTKIWYPIFEIFLGKLILGLLTTENGSISHFSIHASPTGNLEELKSVISRLYPILTYTTRPNGDLDFTPTGSKSYRTCWDTEIRHLLIFLCGSKLLADISQA